MGHPIDLLETYTNCFLVDFNLFEEVHCDLGVELFRKPGIHLEDVPVHLRARVDAREDRDQLGPHPQVLLDLVQHLVEGLDL